MKKILLSAGLFLVSLITFAQTDNIFMLSEEASKEIVKSPEFQNVFKLQNEFLDKISNAVNQGIPLESIRTATIDAVENNNNKPVYSMLFSDYQSGENFFNALSEAKNTFREKHRFIEENKSAFTCSTCSKTLSEEVNFLFNNFQAFNNNRYIPGTSSNTERAAEPVCGSWWNQVRLGICAVACGVVTVGTAGIATAACGWGCWCTFCTQNSALATVICAD